MREELVVDKAHEEMDKQICHVGIYSGYFYSVLCESFSCYTLSC